MMNKLRWKITKILNRLVWFICPEPHKTIIKKMRAASLNRTKAKFHWENGTKVYKSYKDYGSD